MKKTMIAIATLAMFGISSVCSAGYIESGTFKRSGISPGGNFSFSCPGSGQCYTGDGPNKPVPGETIHILRFNGPLDPNFTDAVLVKSASTPGEESQAVLVRESEQPDESIGN